jgi:LysR family transcriptional regulator, transcriptional activator for dmlA
MSNHKIGKKSSLVISLLETFVIIIIKLRNQNSLMMTNNWDLIDLKIFCSVYRYGSFARASTEMGISPAYVSKRIADLERSLKVRLFNRTTRRIQITSEGEVAHTWAIQVLEAAENLTMEVANTKANPSGSLRIGTSFRLGNHHVSNILALLAKKYPDLKIWLELLDRRVDMLAEGIDIDIRAGDIQEPHLVSHLITKSSRILCASPTYLKNKGTPTCLSDLTQHDCLPFRDRDHPFGVWRLEGPNGDETVRVTGAVGSNHSDVVRNWALLDRGIILLSTWDIADHLKQGTLVRVLPEYAQSANIWIVTPARLSSSAKLKVCVEFLIEQLTEGPYSLNNQS